MNTDNTDKLLDKNPELVNEIKKYKNIPVVYMPTKAMVKPVPSPGLLDYIKKAKTEKEIQTLLNKIPQFENAHPSTIRKWKRVAEKRILELKNKTD